MTSIPAEGNLHRPCPDSGPHLRLVSDAIPVDVPAAQAAVRALLTALGEDPSSEHLRETPRRVAAAYAEMLTPEAFTLTTSPTMRATTSSCWPGTCRSTRCASTTCFPSAASRTSATCPATGSSGCPSCPGSWTRFARGLQVQERLTKQVADCLHQSLQPKGVAVVLEAEHQCMSLRGVRAHGARTVTSTLHGLLRDNAATRSEFFILAGVSC